MAAKEGVPPCTSFCASDWKAAEYDKSKFEGTWVVEKDMCGSKGDAVCCGKACVTKHCLCYTCVGYYMCYVPIIPDLTWTCGDNFWCSYGGSTYVYGEGDVVYHQWLCCPYEKWVRADKPQGGSPSVDPMER